MSTQEIIDNESQGILEEASAWIPKNATDILRLTSVMMIGNTMLNERESTFKKAVAYGEAAVKADFNNSNAHTFLAASYGSYAMFIGGREKVKLANRVRDELEIALKLNPDNNIAHSVYGSWHRAVADVSWIGRKLANAFLGGFPQGSIIEAIDHLQQAIRIAPNVLQHHYELALAYLDANRKDLAIESLETALHCPLSLQSDAKRKIDAQKLLSELKF